MDDWHRLCQASSQLLVISWPANMCKLGTRPCANTLKYEQHTVIGAVPSHKVTLLTRVSAGKPLHCSGIVWSCMKRVKAQVFVRTPTAPRLWSVKRYPWTRVVSLTNHWRLHVKYVRSPLAHLVKQVFILIKWELEYRRIVFVYTLAVPAKAAFLIDVPKSCERRLTCKGKLYCRCSSPFICRCESR